MTQPVPFLTTSEVARELFVDSATVRRWIADGKLPVITLPSGHFRVRREVVEAILAGTQPTPDAEPAEAVTS